MSKRPPPEEPAFRHDPVKSVVALRPPVAVDWTAEPAVVAHRRLTAVHRQTGQDVPVPVSASPAVVGGVGVVVASDDGHVRFFDQRLSRSHWERRLDRNIYASLVVDPDRRSVIVASASGLIACLDLRGNLVWSQTLGHPVYATPTLSPRLGLLVVATFHSRCFGLDLADGSVRFETAVPPPWFAEHGGVAAHRDVYASPVIADGQVIVVCAGEHVVGLGPDGTVRWRRDLGVGLKASPVAVGGHGSVAVCALDGSCRLLSTADGTDLAVRRLGARIAASAALSGSVIAVGTQDGRAVGLDARSLDVCWTSAQGAPRAYTSFSVLPSGDFVAVAEQGDAVCLGREDGAFRWQSSQVLGLPEHEPAMDVTPVAAADGHLYGASYEGDVYTFLFRPTGATP